MAVTHHFQLHALQAEVYNSETRFNFLAAGRRGGKSEVGVEKQLRIYRECDIASFRHNVHWVVAPTYKILRTIWGKFELRAPRGWITKTKGNREAPDTMWFGNSVVEFRSGQVPENLVAEGLRSLWVDEAGIIAERAWTESLRPALADYKAPALFTGTPKGKNWFWREWLKGRSSDDFQDYRSFRWHSICNPFVDMNEIKAIEATLPGRTVDQEIRAIFLEGQGDVFRTIGANIKAAVQMFGTDGMCSHPTAFIGCDLGQQIDFTVLHGVCENGHTTGWARFKDLPWPVIKARIINAVDEAEGAILFIDSAGVGKPVVEDLQRELGERQVVPVNTGSNKVHLIEGHMIAVEKREILMPSEPIVRDEHEAFSYEFTKTRRIKYSAPEGLHDDAVIAAALASWGLAHGPTPVEFGVASRASA